jgi:hypothetical protein
MKNPVKRFSPLVVLSILLFSFSAPKVYQANFAGTWSLNSGKSELGQFGGRGIANKIVVDQKADGVTITTTSPGFNGGDPVSVTETLTNDGKESETTVFGTSKRKSKLKWAADGNSFDVSYSLSFGQGEFTGTQHWSLSADSKTMTVKNSVTTQQGDFSTTAVYDKQ